MNLNGHIVNLNKDEPNNGMDFYYQPIPLSEEWLQRFGFLPWGSGNIIPKPFWIKDHFVISLSQKLTGINIDDTTDALIKHCEFVHQLQNAYYSLTGEELTINQEAK